MFRFFPIEDPIIETVTKEHNDISIGLDYQKSDENNDDFLCKFLIIVPVNKEQSIKIKHAFVFQVEDESIINPTSEKFADFLAMLLDKTAAECNKRLNTIVLDFSKDKILPKVRALLFSHNN